MSDDDRFRSQGEKSAHWPRRWIPREAMCKATQRGTGAGEGSPRNPGWVACARLAGHRDIRWGGRGEHLWGPERYSESRALHAANRLATEDWVAMDRVMSTSDTGGESAQVREWLAGAPERDRAPAGPDDPEEIRARLADTSGEAGP